MVSLSIVQKGGRVVEGCRGVEKREPAFFQVAIALSGEVAFLQVAKTMLVCCILR